MSHRESTAKWRSPTPRGGRGSATSQGYITSARLSTTSTTSCSRPSISTVTGTVPEKLFVGQYGAEETATISREKSIQEDDRCAGTPRWTRTATESTASTSRAGLRSRRSCAGAAGREGSSTLAIRSGPISARRPNGSRPRCSVRRFCRT